MTDSVQQPRIFLTVSEGISQRERQQGRCWGVMVDGAPCMQTTLDRSIALSVAIGCQFDMRNTDRILTWDGDLKQFIN